MKNGRGPLNRNGPKENKANIIDEKLNLNKLQSLEINTSNLRQKQILQIDEITTCLTMSKS